jgi:Spy/CpxP family protein refolding chaperone
MRIRATLLCLIILVATHLADGWAQEPMGKGPRERHPPCWLPEDLHLTDTQMEIITSIQRRYLGEIRTLRGDLLNQRHDFKRLLSDPTSEAADIRARHNGVLAVESRIQEKILDYQLEVREVLTSEQFTLWVSKQRKPPRPRPHRKGGMGMMP